MKAPLEWLKEFVEIRLSPDDLLARLTMSGTEVNGLEFHGKITDGVVVGKVKGKSAHPNMPDMSIAQIDIGKKIIQVVSPTQGIGLGDKVPVAQEGATLAKGLKVKKADYHGVESFGMLCCGHEIGAEFTAQILKLPKDAQIGMDVRKVIGLGGYVLDLDILPNRGDCLSILGVAQEIAAITKKALKKYSVKLQEKGLSIKDKLTLEIKAKNLCPRYMARVIEGVKVKESPEWLKNRLLLAGLRPINNIVDITNYVLMETGQPLHAFDANLLSDNTILVRRANKGEKIKTLDELEYTLSEEDLVIADAKKAIALAGIMGGLNSAVNDKTKAIVLESAYFDPQTINKTAKRLKIKTDASIRFERGVDWERVSLALNKAAQMLSELAEGNICRGFIDVKSISFKLPRIRLHVNRLNQILGTKISLREVKEILQRLGLRILGVQASAQVITVEIPGSRAQDLTRGIDLIEEVARIHGYENIPATIANTAFENKSANLSFPFLRELREILRSSGLDEACTYSMISLKDLKNISLKDGDRRLNSIGISNPLSEEESIMRTTLLPGLLNALKYNQYRQTPDIALYEIGKVFFPAKETADEKLVLAGAITGSLAKSPISTKQLTPDIFWLKGILENMFQALSIEMIKFAPGGESYLQATSGAKIKWGQAEIGVLGLIHPAVLKNFDITGQVLYFEVEIEKIISSLPMPIKKFKSLPKVPSVSRDIAMFTPENIASAEIEKAIMQAGAPLAESVSLFDYYKGKPVPDGYVNLAYRITYRDMDKTLTDDEVNAKHNEVLKVLQNNFNLQIRR